MKDKRRVATHTIVDVIIVTNLASHSVSALKTSEFTGRFGKSDGSWGTEFETLVSVKDDSIERSIARSALRHSVLASRAR